MCLKAIPHSEWKTLSAYFSCLSGHVAGVHISNDRKNDKGVTILQIRVYPATKLERKEIPEPEL
jgi:hypothetical protein